MTVSIFAGTVTNLQWDAAAKDFKPATAGAEAVFGVRQMDFWQFQVVHDATLTPVDRARAILTNGLASINGSAEDAAKFIANPAPALVNPLVAKIVDIALGN